MGLTAYTCIFVENLENYIRLTLNPIALRMAKTLWSLELQIWWDLNPIALRMAKTLSFGHSECNRVKIPPDLEL